MWYRYILFFGVTVSISILLLQVSGWAFSIKHFDEFQRGSLVGWVWGSVFMLIYLNYGRDWIWKEKVKDESVGVHLDNKEAIKSKAIHLGFKMDGAPLENHTLLDTMIWQNERCVVQVLPTGVYQFQLINTGSANLCDNEWHQLIVHYSPSIVSIDGNLDSVAIMKNNKDVDTEWTFKDNEYTPDKAMGAIFDAFELGQKSTQQKK